MMKIFIKRAIVAITILAIMISPSYTSVGNEALQTMIGNIKPSGNYKNMDGLNITSVNIKYDPSVGGLFTYEVRGYFYDKNPPYATPESSMVNIKYINFASSDHEFLTNGSNYYDGSFYATVFDGVTFPNIMIYPQQNPIIMFFNQTFCLTFELSVALANPVPITVQLTAFNNASDTVSLTCSSYLITYYLKTNILINSQYFNKDNVIVKMNDSQVDPNNVYVTSKTSDIKVYDKQQHLLYHCPSSHWSATTIINFTSAKIQNDYYSSVLASMAPISVIDAAFYQSSSANFTDADQRFTEDGAFNNIYQGSHLIYGTDRLYALIEKPANSPIDQKWKTNVYDKNGTTLPTSMEFNSSNYEYPWFSMYPTGSIDNTNTELTSIWIKTPPNDNSSMMIIPFYSPFNSSVPAENSLLVIGIFNGSIWDMTRLFEDNFSIANCTKLSPLAGNTWYNIAIFLGNLTMNATVFVNAKAIATLDDQYSSYNIESGILFALNYTTMKKFGVGGFVATNGIFIPSYEKNATTAFRAVFYLADLWIKGYNTNAKIIVNGRSTIAYANSTAFNLNVKTRGDFYEALPMPVDSIMLDDFMNFMYIPSKTPYINETPYTGVFTDLSLTNCYFVPDCLGHGNPINFTSMSSLTLNAHSSDYGGNFNQYENVTWEFWVYAAGAKGYDSINLYDSNSTDNLQIRFYSASNMMSIPGIVNVTINPSIWNHVRLDFTIKKNSISNETTNVYVNDVLMSTFSVFSYNTEFDTFYVYGDGYSVDSLCIDAIGMWRSSWANNPSLSHLYTVGDNEKLISPTHKNGQFTLDTTASGKSITNVDSGFVYDSRFESTVTNAGNVTYFNNIHDNVYDLQRTESWASIFSSDVPIIPFNEYLLPNGYGYETRGRVSFWFYANSSGGASKYIFAVYDNGGTPKYLQDDRLNGFVVGSALDDSNSSSIISYFTKINGVNYIKQSNYVLTNDSWNYFVFEWNSTGNTLWINQQLIFNGLSATVSDTNTVVSEHYSNKSGFTIVWNYISSKNALEYFTSYIDTNTLQLIPSQSVRTAFLFNSIPYINYAANISRVGAIWHTSFGHIDNLNFEYDTSQQFDYAPAMMSISTTVANFTVQTSLTKTFSLSMLKNITLYQGAYYNISFVVSATIDSYPLQLFGDSNEYIIFVSSTQRRVNVLVPIDVTKPLFTIKLWSVNGSYTIQNFSIELTSTNPQVVDSFKYYMQKYATYSTYVGMNQIIDFNITTGNYYLLAETIPTMDVANFDTVIIDGHSNEIDILPPSLRDITIAYSDQRGQAITNVRTYLKIGSEFILQPSNVFQAEIGSKITILARDVFNEVVYYGTYTVLSFSNYLNIIIPMHSLEIYNQDEYFANYTITKAFAPGFYWSRYIYPKTGVEERLTTGTYTIAVRDHLDTLTTYRFNLFGDDYLLIRSGFTIENAINNIKNVNSSIGNQITNVGINITNQNSRINNSIVNVDIRLNNINSTLGTQLLNMQANVISVNSTINAQTAYITGLLANVNSTIFSQTNHIQSLLANVNSTINDQTTILSTLFTNVNSTILSQSANMQQYLININNTINSANVNLTQGFFTDLLNRQTGNLTGVISSVVNNQTNTVKFQINNITAYISRQLVNVNNSIINSTIKMTGSINYNFSQISSSNIKIQQLIQRVSFSSLINWSEDVQITGIVALTLTNSYPFPILFELKRGNRMENYTIYTENFVKTYVPGGLYQYRMRDADNGTFVKHKENESIIMAAIFEDFFVSNNSNYISTSFARVPIPITITTTGNDLTNVIVVFVFIGVIVLVIYLVWRDRRSSAGGRDITGAIDGKSHKSKKKGQPINKPTNSPSLSRRTRPATEVGGVSHGKSSKQTSVTRNGASKRKGILG